jgi:putative endonuclease
MREHRYFVYILTNCSRHPLYTGVTRSLGDRHGQHKTPVPWENSYTGHYKLNRLVYFEQFQYVKNAIGREKQIKRWSRAKKIALIERMNPKWDDLSRIWRGLPIGIQEESEPRSLDCAQPFRKG